MLIRKLCDGEIESAIKAISYLGYAVIPCVLSNAVIDSLLSKIGSLEKASAPISPKSGITVNQLRDKYVYHLQFKDIDFIRILTDGNLLEILKPFIQDPYYTQLAENQFNFLLAYYNARSSMDSLPLHIDNYIPTGGCYPNSMQIVFSLNGQNASNGATTIVPGSHNIQRYPDRKTRDIETVLSCDPGDVIIWDSRLWHGALENKTGKDRWSLVATFRPWWAKQNFDVVRGLPEDIWLQLNPQMKALLGFLSLPPRNEAEKISLKQGYESLLDTLAEYRKK